VKYRLHNQTWEEYAMISMFPSVNDFIMDEAPVVVAGGGGVGPS
jgi:hypothetical protein